MTTLYLRKVKVTLSPSKGGSAVVINPGRLTDRQIRVEFSITKDLSGQANTGTFRIYNLAAGSRNAVGRELDNIKVEAGYLPPNGGGNLGVLFKGQIRDAAHLPEGEGGEDIVTEINCGDGDRALRTAVLSKTYPRGTKVSQVIEDLHGEFGKQGIDRGEWKGVDELGEFKRPYSMCGPCAREMDRLGRSHGFYWSSQNEALEIVPGDQFLDSAIRLNTQTGLIGIPTITDNGAQFECLMIPSLAPGRKVVLESRVVEMNAEGGVYRASTCTYAGDNMDGDFKIVTQAEAVRGGKVDEGKDPA